MGIKHAPGRLVQVARFDERRPAWNARWPFAQDATYQIDDGSPYLWLGLDHSAGFKCDVGSTTRPRELPGGFVGDPALHWTKWCPFGEEKQIAEERRFGRFQASISWPCRATFRCYVSPQRLMNSATFVQMVEEIDAELGVLELSDAAALGTRQYIADTRLSSTAVVELARRLEDEVRAARSVLRRRYRENLPAAPGRIASRMTTHDELQDLPEHRLIRAWCHRRLAQIGAVRQRVLDAQAELESLGVDAVGNLHRVQGLTQKQLFLQNWYLAAR